jgi:hypothetical protein
MPVCYFPTSLFWGLRRHISGSAQNGTTGNQQLPIAVSHLYRSSRQFGWEFRLPDKPMLCGLSTTESRGQCFEFLGSYVGPEKRRNNFLPAQGQAKPRYINYCPIQITVAPSLGRQQQPGSLCWPVGFLFSKGVRAYTKTDHNTAPQCVEDYLSISRSFARIQRLALCSSAPTRQSLFSGLRAEPNITCRNHPSHPLSRNRHSLFG